MGSLKAAFQLEGIMAQRFGSSMKRGITSMMSQNATSASRMTTLRRMTAVTGRYLGGNIGVGRSAASSWKSMALRTGVVAGAGLVGAYGASRVVQSDSMVGGVARFGIGAGLVGGGAYLGYRNWGKISGAMASRFGRRGTTAATRHIPGGRSSTSPGSLGTDMGRGSYGPTPMARPVVPPLPPPRGAAVTRAMRRNADFANNANIRARAMNRPPLMSGRGSIPFQGRRNNQGFTARMYNPSNTNRTTLPYIGRGSDFAIAPRMNAMGASRWSSSMNNPIRNNRKIQDARRLYGM